MFRFVVVAAVFAGAIAQAAAFTRCRLSEEECRIVAEERYRLDVIAAYERSIPSSRTAYKQEMFLIDRKEKHFDEAIARLPRPIAAEMVRMLVCDTAEEIEISGRGPANKPEDCD